MWHKRLLVLSQYVSILKIVARWFFFSIYAYTQPSSANKNHFTLKNYEIHIHKLCAECVSNEFRWNNNDDRKKNTHAHIHSLNLLQWKYFYKISSMKVTVVDFCEKKRWKKCLWAVQHFGHAELWFHVFRVVCVWSTCLRSRYKHALYLFYGLQSIKFDFYGCIKSTPDTEADVQSTSQEKMHKNEHWTAEAITHADRDEA